GESAAASTSRGPPQANRARSPTSASKLQSTRLEMSFERGLLLGARFRLVNRIGVGTLGELWRAVDRVPTKPIAIRLVRPSVPVASAALEGFGADSAAAMALRHSSIAKVLAVGDSDGIPWAATELLLAETLESLLARRRAILPGAALRLISDLGEAIAE